MLVSTILGELGEEIAGVPVWTLGLLRDLITCSQIHAGALDRRIEVEGLIHVIAGLVVALCFPVELHFLAIKIRIYRLQSFSDVQRRHPLQDEGILIAAYEIDFFRRTGPDSR